MSKSILLIAASAVVATACSSSPPPRPAPRVTYVAPAPAVTASVTAGVSITLSSAQAASVRPYLAGTVSTDHEERGHGRGHGHGRNGDLPPGIAKNLERGKPLPPGIAKTYLPPNVVAGLPRLPSGLDYVVVAGKLLLVEAATAAIHDVLLDAAFDR